MTRRFVCCLLSFFFASTNTYAQTQAPQFAIPAEARSAWFDGEDLLVVQGRELELLQRNGARTVLRLDFPAEQIIGNGRGAAAVVAVRGHRGQLAIRRNGTWTVEQVPETTEHHFPWAIMPDGTLYALVRGTLHRWNGTWSRASAQSAPSSTQLFATHDGQLLLLGDRALYTLRNEQIEAITLHTPPTVRRHEWNSACWSRSSNALWIGTNQGAVFSINPSNGRFTQLRSRGQWPVRELGCSENTRGPLIAAASPFYLDILQPNGPAQRRNPPAFPHAVLDPSAGALYWLDPFHAQAATLPGVRVLVASAPAQETQTITLTSRPPPVATSAAPRIIEPAIRTVSRLSMPAIALSGLSRTPIEPDGPASHYYDDPPDPRRYINFRLGLGGGIDARSLIVPALLFDVMLGFRYGLRPGVWQPGFWSELGYSILRSNVTQHLFVIGGGIQAQGDGLSFGWMPKLYVGSDPNGVSFGLRNMLHFDLAYGSFSIQLLHQIGSAGGALAQFAGASLSMDPAAMIFNARRRNQ